MQLLLSCLALIAALVCHSSSAGAETLTVRVSGLHGSSGVLHLMLWRDAAGFPTQPERAAYQKAVAVTGAHMEVSFSGLNPGSYAAAAYQDVNGNGKLDRSIFGWPIEPTGASNGASGTVGPPKFADAVFELRPPAKVIDLNLK
jgi:uncharacterized protein (DUF2141 family)